MLLTQTTPMSHALLMHQTYRTQLTLLLQNVQIYLHHVHNTILILELINQQHGSFLQLRDFSGPILLDLSDLLNVIAHLQSNLPDLPSLLLLLLLFSFYAVEKKFLSSPATKTQKKTTPFLLLFFFFWFPPVPSSLRSETYLLT